MSVFSSLGAEDYDRKYSDKELIRRIADYFKPHIKMLLFIASMVIIVSSAGAVQPLIVSKSIEYFGENFNLSLIGWMVLGILSLNTINWFANLLRRQYTVQIIADVAVKLAEDGFQASIMHDLSFYDEFTSGRIQSRITSDTRDFGTLIAIITDLVSQLFESILLAIILLQINVTLSLIVFTIIPVVFIFTYLYRNLARRVTRAGMQAMAEVNTTIKETISGISVAKNFRQEKSVFELFTEANQLSYRVNIKRGFVLSFVFPVLHLFAGFAIAALVYFGSMTVQQGMVTAATWYLFTISLDRFLYPVMNLSSFITQIQTGLSAAERVFALIDAESSVKQTDNIQAGGLSGKITFDHVGIRYKTGEPVVEDLELDIKAGESVAFVGHTGAGKTTIARMIARFYEYQSGRLLIDGKDIRSFDLNSYRNNLGIVTQVPFLFSGTIMDNIRYACENVPEDEIHQIAYSIGNGEWVESLSNGFYTQVGERGNLLSMGQKQLVALMRVLVQKPAIFILDEATASIDPFTERQIQKALNIILSKTTSILIAHRLSTIKSADRIIVLDSGRIIESGDHDQLIALNGGYADLYQTYFRHQSLDYVNKAYQFKEQ
ncbi:MAG: ABC transporter ATP-binding protein [Anaerolineaceae bacterium]|nr:ABC transporter ATP-binding protein [Anaerolineaceae bacterium]